MPSAVRNGCETRYPSSRTHRVSSLLRARDGRQLQSRLLQERLDLRAAGERRLEQVEGFDAACRTESRSLSVNLGSVLGCVRVVRQRSQRAGPRGLAPTDAMLLGLDPSQIAAGMRRAATRQHLATAARKPVDVCARYLINNRRWLDDQTALSHGFPISTGVVEGACRHLVKDRMDRTGARWSLLGAEAVLRLRAVRASGDFADSWAFRLHEERCRNHLSRYPDPKPPNPMPPPRPAKAHLRRIK